MPGCNVLDCRRVTPALMEGWQRFTTGPFQLLAVPGNHLWPLNDRDSKAAWLACVVAALQDVAEDTGEGARHTCGGS